MNYRKMFTKRADGRYCATYTDESGKRRYVYDKDPERLYMRLHSPVYTVRRFEEVAKEWEAAYRETVSVRTWDNLRPHYNDIVTRFGHMPIESVSASDVYADLLAAKNAGYSRTVVNERRVIFNGIFNHALISGGIKANPAASVRLPRNLPHTERRPPTEDEVRIICDHKDTALGFLPFFLLCTGLRRGEALALHKRDVSLTRREITVSKALVWVDPAKPEVKAPKTEAGYRTVPIIDALYRPLKHYMSGVDDILFPQAPSNRNAQPNGYMTEHSFQGAWSRYCASVGLWDVDKPSITPHQLRHGTATLLFEAGVDAYTAKEVLGHSNIRTTMEIYTGLREAQKRKSLSMFNGALSEMLSDSEQSIENT